MNKTTEHNRQWIFHGEFEISATYYADADQASVVRFRNEYYYTRPDAPMAMFVGIIPTDERYWKHIDVARIFDDGVLIRHEDTIMNARQFFEKVREMRAAQNTYFKTRNNNDLNRARSLEREIDAEIKRVDAVIAERSAGPSLFENQ